MSVVDEARNDSIDDLGLDVWRTLPAAQQPSWPDDVVLLGRAAAELAG